MHIVIGGYCPGALGRVAEMHAEYYHRHWGFGLFFEAKVATNSQNSSAVLKRGAMVSGHS